MLFPSIEFLFLFLPVVLGGYYLLPFKWGLKNCWLLISSVIFYAWGEPTFVLVMLGSIALNYVLAAAIDAFRGRAAAKPLLWVAVMVNISVIGVWKYANFITANLREWIPSLQGVVPQTSILLPIGISFFTFQAMSYVIDVHRGVVKVQKNPVNLALYIALFPQLIAGPIVRYSTVCEQIEKRSHSWERFSSGLMRFMVGFNKKMLIANLVSVAADKAFAASELSAAMAWLGAVCYTLQIYFDFSGYSDMAIGLGRMFGFEFLENFNYPYISRTVTEFWRRWHMSLGSWFRDYVYFPLGGSRVGKRRLFFNLFIVWMLTGVWHGANWTFILWGVLYGLLIMIEKTCDLPDRVESSARLRCLWQPITMLAVVAGWVLFRSADISSAGHYLGAMFGFGPAGFWDKAAVFEFMELRLLLPVAIIACVPLRWTRRFVAENPLLQFGLFWIGVSYIVMNAHNPFIYFNF